jgi:hypothetical protein
MSLGAGMQADGKSLDRAEIDAGEQGLGASDNKWLGD